MENWCRPPVCIQSSPPPAGMQGKLTACRTPAGSSADFHLQPLQRPPVLAESWLCSPSVLISPGAPCRWAHPVLTKGSKLSGIFPFPEESTERSRKPPAAKRSPHPCLHPSSGRMEADKDGLLFRGSIHHP